MDFEQILNEWESGRKTKKNQDKHKKAKSPQDGTNSYNEKWIDLYPPGSDVLKLKDKEEVPPVSEGRSVWLRRPHQDTLDLHGHTEAEARAMITGFITSMRRRNLRKGLIILGKGLHSHEGSVLKPLVREFLEQSSDVGEFRTAAHKDGGSGATWFILRQRSL